MAKYKNEEEVLANYDPNEYPRPVGYVSDIAVFTIVPKNEEELNLENQDDEDFTPLVLKVMLIKRSLLDNKGEPNVEPEKWALPGGFVFPNETAFEAAKRRLAKETNVDKIHIQSFGTYDQLGRDKRGWIISNAHYAIVPEKYLENRKPSEDAEEVELFSMEEVFQMDLAFDHKIIIHDALNIIKRDMVQTTIAKHFLENEFVLSEYRHVLMAVVDVPAIKSISNFFRKTPKLPFIEEVLDKENKPKKTTPTATRKRGAKLYTFNDFNPVPTYFD